MPVRRLRRRLPSAMDASPRWGRPTEVRKLAGPATRVVDLGGRTVIPGLIDSHLHAIRAALSFSTEVNWIGARSLEEALGRIRAAARTMKPGSWLIVAGGWNVQQFEENRRPTQAELTAVAPGNPVYVQLGYGWAMLNPQAHKALGISQRGRFAGRRALRTGRQRKLDRRRDGRAERDRRVVRSASEAHVRRTGRRHESVLPRAQSPGDDRRGRSRRKQSHVGRLPGTLQGVARQGDDRARRVHAERPDTGQGIRRTAGAHGSAAHGLWRRHAALQRPR